MAELRNQDKRDKLRLIYAKCQSDKIPLQAALLAALKECDDAITNGGAAPGTWLSSTAENGGSSSFSMLYDYTPTVARRLMGEINDGYDAAVEKLARHFGDKLDDVKIYNWLMRFYFKSIRRYRNDYTGLRYGVGFYFGTQ